MGSGIDKRALDLSVYDVLLETRLDRRGGAAQSTSGGYDVARRQPRARRRRNRAGRARAPRRAPARRARARSHADYDFVLIDCPPSLSLLTLNGLCSAHGVIVPMQCEYFALEGLSDLVNTIKQVHANLNPRPRGDRHPARDVRCPHHAAGAGQRAAQGALRRQGVRHRRSRATSASPKRRATACPGVVFDPTSKGALAFIEFAREMVGARRRLARRAAAMSEPAPATVAIDPALLGPRRRCRHQRQRAARAALGRRLAGPPVAGQGQARALHPGGRAGAARRRRQARPVPAALRRRRPAARSFASRRSPQPAGLDAPSGRARHGARSTTPG